MFDQNTLNNHTVILCFTIVVFFIFYFYYYFKITYSCDGRAELSASLLKSSVSHDSSEIINICWFAAQEA